MVSNNPSGADNQQERPIDKQWIVGFVDGEGCFSVPIFRNATTKFGWQVQPQFSVVQSERSVDVLHGMKQYFESGQVGKNTRHDNHREDMYRFTVRAHRDLVSRIVPFFEKNPLVTAKSLDFDVFAEIVRMMAKGVHRSFDGLCRIAEMTQTMNRKKPSCLLESSEAIRQLSPSDGEIKRWSGLHGDMQRNPSEIPCRVSSDLHEWRNDFTTVSTTDPAKLKYE